MQAAAVRHEHGAMAKLLEDVSDAAASGHWLIVTIEAVRPSHAPLGEDEDQGSIVDSPQQVVPRPIRLARN
jgi:hypothetical protein